MARVIIIGGGIVGLATARALLANDPALSVVVVEKEDRWAAHQTSRNSGVIHSGIYYTPGSAKAAMCGAGAASMIEFAESHGLPFRRCGKLIVATDPEELPRLDRLHERAVANGVTISRMTQDEAREIEPHVRCLAALHAPNTSITDFAAVCGALAEELKLAGADLRTSAAVVDIARRGQTWHVETTAGGFDADVVVNCAGLQSDKIARMSGARISTRIVPFRGEYYELQHSRSHLVRGLIYPVPDPAFPFLGVHLTTTLDGGVHAGPNAVLAFAREGYRRTTIRPSELAATLAFPGFWKLARKNLRMGTAEMARSFSRKRFAASLQRMVPEIVADDLVPAPAGVRAQALNRDGSLVDDFLIVQHERSVHVLNAPSPAATSALEIGKHLAGQIAAVL